MVIAGANMDAKKSKETLITLGDTIGAHHKPAMQENRWRGMPKTLSMSLFHMKEYITMDYHPQNLRAQHQHQHQHQHRHRHRHRHRCRRQRRRRHRHQHRHRHHRAIPVHLQSAGIPSNHRDRYFHFHRPALSPLIPTMQTLDSFLVTDLMG